MLPGKGGGKTREKHTLLKSLPGERQMRVHRTTLANSHFGFIHSKSCFSTLHEGVCGDDEKQEYEEQRSRDGRDLERSNVLVNIHDVYRGSHRRKKDESGWWTGKI